MNSTETPSIEALENTVHNLLLDQNISLTDATQKGSHRNTKISQRELELALTVLLVDLASADQNFDHAEYTVIVHGLMRLFGTGKEETSALIHQAQTVLRNLRGVSRFGNTLKEHLSREEKHVVLEIIEDVIQADGVENEFEVYLKYKFRTMIGLDENI